MKTTTRKIIQTILSDDDTISNDHRKGIMKVIDNPEVLNGDKSTNNRQMVSLKEAGRRFNVSPKTIRRLIDMDQLRVHRLSAHVVRVDIAELESIQADKATVKNKYRGRGGRFAKNNGCDGRST